MYSVCIGSNLVQVLFCGCDRGFFPVGFLFLLFQVRVSCRSDMAELAAFSAVGFCSLPCSISLWRYWNTACWTCPPLASRQKILNRFPQLDRLAIAAGTSLLLTAPLRYPRTFWPFPRCIFFEQSFFPLTIKLWDGLEMGLRGLEHTDFKIKLKEIFKPPKFKHYNVGFKFPNSLHTQLRLKRSNLNSHLYSIGLCITPACKCGSGQLETVKHFLLECKLYEQARGQLFAKLEGLLEMRVSKYTKSNLLEILLHGEKPHLYDKFQHNKFIFYSVQRFICQTKRLYTMPDANKPCNIAIPNNGDNP